MSISKINKAFTQNGLRRACTLHETEFGEAYNLPRFNVENKYGRNADFYYYGDNGSPILFVAHLDTVIDHADRMCDFVRTAAGPMVWSGALDDRLGAYIGLDLLPRLGLEFDVLLTTGEEQGASTAEFFKPEYHHDRGYNWIIEFDRGGTDVVTYQYEDDMLVDMIEDTGAYHSPGIFSDISYMDSLGVKAMNWGVGYQDYHSIKGHAYLDDTFKMVNYFLDFHDTWGDTLLPHVPGTSKSLGRSNKNWWDEEPNPDYDETVHSECDWHSYKLADCAGAVADGEHGRLCARHEKWAS